MYAKCSVCGFDGEHTFSKFDETEIIKSGNREKVTKWICSTCKALEERAKARVAMQKAKVNAHR